MPDLNLINQNLKKIKDAGLPFSEAERYLAREGVTPEQIKEFNLAQKKPNEPVEQKMSATKKIAALAGQIGTGSAFGAGDILAGILNVPVTGYENIAKLAMGQPIEKKSIPELYKAGREQFKTQQEKVREESPLLATSAELTGGLTSMGLGVAGAPSKAGILAKTLQAAKTGAGFGAAYGAGSQAGEVFAGKKTIPKAIAGTALSAGLGGVLGGGIQAGGSILGKVGKTVTGALRGKSAEQQAIKKVVEKLGAPQIEKALAENVPLIETGTDEITQLAQKAKLRSPAARKLLVEKAEKSLELQPQKIGERLNKVFGEKTPLQNLDEIQAKYQTEAKPMWDIANSHGNIANENTTKIVQDPFIQDYILKARNSALGRGLKDLPDTDIRVLQATKEFMDDDISKFFKAGENKQGAALLQAKKELVDNVDNSVAAIEGVPKKKSSYYLARKASADKFALENAQKTAENIFTRKNRPEDIKRIVDDFSNAEKDAFLIKVKDELLSKIEQAAKTGRRNVAEAVFGASDEFQIRKQLETILDKKGFDDLMQVVNKEAKTGRGFATLLGGSQTAEKEALKEIPLTLGRLAKKGFEFSMGIAEGKKQKKIAEILLENKELKRLYDNLNAGSKKRLAAELLRKQMPRTLGQIYSTQQQGE